MALPDPTKVEAALREFVTDIERTGGVFIDEKGNTCPHADEEWIDIAATYMKACAALGIEPVCEPQDA